MPKNKNAAIMDIGSSNITILAGEHGVNRIFNIKGKGVANYSGFSEGEFLEPEKLFQAVKRALKQTEDSIKSKIKKLYIGVPGEFTTTISKEATISFKNRRKVTEIDVQELYLSEILKDSSYTLINKKPAYYNLDDNRKVLQPIGHISSKLEGLLTFNYAENKFINTFKNIAENLNIYETEFISSVLAEANLLFEEKDKRVLFADIGYLTTSVSLYQGEGLLFLKSFSSGGGHIAADLMECLNIDFGAAEILKDQIRLNFEITEEDKYKITYNEKSFNVTMKTANEIVSARIEVIGEMIKRCLKQSPYDIPAYMPLYLTGGGLSYIRGATDILSGVLDRNIEIISPNTPQFCKPHLSSSIGVFDFALSKEEKEKKGFWSKLFR